MSSRLFLACAAGTVLLAACTGPDPVATPEHPAARVAPGIMVSPETVQLEGLARRLAVALGDPAFRSRFRARLEASPYPEHKLHLQRTLAGEGGAELRAVARLNGEPDRRTDSVLGAAQALEVYLPVPSHRQRWRGDAGLLGAALARDGDLPAAFDLHGGRHLLDPTRPPQTPVLAVVPVETDFDQPPPVRGDATCLPGTSCGGGGSLVAPGLYMTKAHFVDDFESWLKGSPELEIQVLGQLGTSDSLTKYRCSAEHQPSPYLWDGDTDWSGSVLLFSQAEMNTYHQAHPGETFRIVALEDDDTACEIRIDDNRWSSFVGTIGPLYQDVTGAIDSGGVSKFLAAGRSLRKFLSKLAAVIKTNDDLIGNAMEDKVVGEFHPGYNWILRADDNATNGWINLQMK
ncbi:MAG TPA: hypothetical protein PKA50_01100 [Gemmatimonadales bacterium]|nr:hypothetical protein [Gemmatimonadales bacterium]